MLREMKGVAAEGMVPALKDGAAEIADFKADRLVMMKIMIRKMGQTIERM